MALMAFCLNLPVVLFLCSSPEAFSALACWVFKLWC